jgi:hypothetical protein
MSDLSKRVVDCTLGDVVEALKPADGKDSFGPTRTVPVIEDEKGSKLDVKTAWELKEIVDDTIFGSYTTLTRAQIAEMAREQKDLPFELQTKFPKRTK